MQEITSPARLGFRIRFNKELLWSHRWIPSVVASASWLVFLATLFWRKSSLTIFLSAGVALVCSYAWGYSERAFRLDFTPALKHLKRRQYAEVWDALATDRELASVSACGEREETEVRSSVQDCLRSLLELARISRTDEVLEIGCGVGRVGRELAAHCKSWTGCDVSANMLSFAKERLQGILNTRLIALRGVGLSEFKTASFDVVFATNMLGHLDEMDRWRYVEEAFAKPGATVCVWRKSRLFAMRMRDQQRVALGEVHQAGRSREDQSFRARFDQRGFIAQPAAAALDATVALDTQLAKLDSKPPADLVQIQP